MSYHFSPVSIEELKPQKVICTRVISFEPENDSNQLVRNWIIKHKLDPSACRSFGFDIPVSPAEAQTGLRGYEIGFVIPEIIQGDDQFKTRTYGGGMYAVMRVHNAFETPFESIPAGWGTLMNWIESNPDWQPAWHTCYEEVIKGEIEEDLILYQPIQKRKELIIGK
ncbi:MAG: GyrI-like domain-containing protein [Chloroflexota bacterium]